MVGKAALYLLLAALGLLVPYSQFLPWLAEHGLNFPRLLFEVLHSRISAFAWADVFISVLTISVFAFWESRRLGLPFPVWPLLGCVLVGASFGLPLFLYQREQALRRLNSPSL